MRKLIDIYDIMAASNENAEACAKLLGVSALSNSDYAYIMQLIGQIARASSAPKPH
jgi:hypothetical protein